MQGVAWDNYLRPPAISAAAHKANSAATFAQQKANIAKLCRLLRPRSVVCMGSGYLNDIPAEDLIAIGADIYFAEWIDDITQQSFRYDLVNQIAERFVCAACKCSGDPKKYCRSYREDGHDFSAASDARQDADHCDNFLRAEDGAFPLCANYAAGEFPRFLHADVTQGIAAHFARQIPSILARAQKPQHAFRYAIRASEHPNADAPLPLADHSVDFITSSMVASQFDFEPYTYFVSNLYSHFGRDTLERNIAALNELEETLRNNLFLTQVEGHCREMLRLLAPDGRIYFSIEKLHSGNPSEHWFYADMASKTMEIVARHFLFDLETFPDIVAPERADMVRGGSSIVYSYLLLPKISAGAFTRA